MWPLAAKILAGPYAETVYEFAEMAEGDLVRYEVEYHSRDVATVRASDVRLRVVSSVNTTYTAGDIHYVDAGVWHETTIADAVTVVTVMVTGRPQLDSPMLAGPPGFTSGPRSREPVSRQQFLDHFGHLVAETDRE
jgi:hypothetical protein